MRYACDNCDFTTDTDENFKSLYEVDSLAERLDPGCVVPAGECPECGAFVYIEDQERCEHTGLTTSEFQALCGSPIDEPVMTKSDWMQITRRAHRDAVNGVSVNNLIVDALRSRFGKEPW